MSDKKYFVLMQGGKDTSQVFASKQPRGAALKAATRGHRYTPKSVEPRESTASLAAYQWLTSLQTAQPGFLTRSRRQTSRKSVSDTFDTIIDLWL